MTMLAIRRMIRALIENQDPDPEASVKTLDMLPSEHPQPPAKKGTLEPKTWDPRERWIVQSVAEKRYNEYLAKNPNIKDPVLREKLMSFFVDQVRAERSRSSETAKINRAKR